MQKGVVEVSYMMSVRYNKDLCLAHALQVAIFNNNLYDKLTTSARAYTKETRAEIQFNIIKSHFAYSSHRQCQRSSFSVTIIVGTGAQKR